MATFSHVSHAGVQLLQLGIGLLQLLDDIAEERDLRCRRVAEPLPGVEQTGERLPRVLMAGRPRRRLLTHLLAKCQCGLPSGVARASAVLRCVTPQITCDLSLDRALTLQLLVSGDGSGRANDNAIELRKTGGAAGECFADEPCSHAYKGRDIFNRVIDVGRSVGKLMHRTFVNDPPPTL